MKVSLGILLCVFAVLGNCIPVPNDVFGQVRNKRNLDFSFEAEHEEGMGTDILAEAIANIWKSKDGRTLIDASAKYSQHFGHNNENNGNTKFGGKINFKQIY